MRPLTLTGSEPCSQMIRKAIAEVLQAEA